MKDVDRVVSAHGIRQCSTIDQLLVVHKDRNMLTYRPLVVKGVRPYGRVLAEIGMQDLANRHSIEVVVRTVDVAPKCLGEGYACHRRRLVSVASVGLPLASH